MATGNKGVKGRAILLADGDVTANERHKLPQWLADEAAAKSTALEGAGQKLNAANRTQKSAAGRLKKHVRTGSEIVRDLNKQINGAPREVDKDAVKAAYGLPATSPSSFTQSEIEGHLRDFAAVNPDDLPEDTRLRPAMRALIATTQQGISDDKLAAGLGPVRQAFNERKAAQTAHDDIVNRVGLFLGATLPGSLFDPLLGNYGLKARKARSTPKPRAIKKLSSVTLPDGTLRLVWSGSQSASTYILFRKVPGEQAAFTVYKSDLTELTLELPSEPRGMELQFYVVGHNSTGDGPASPTLSVTI